MTDVELLGEIEAEVKVHRANGEIETHTMADIDEATQLYVLLRKAELLRKGYLL